MSALPVRRIVFRLAFGGSAGWGHLARCSALAAELRARGWECLAWTDGMLAAAPDDLRAPFTRVLPAGSRWVEQPPPEIAASAWLVVDDYLATDEDLAALRGRIPGVRLLVVDDEARRALAQADLVLNARLGLQDSPYAMGVKSLLGAQYALLRRGLRAPVAVTSPFSPGLAPWLIMLGGTDPLGLTAKVVTALAEVAAPRVAPVVLRGRVLPGADALARALERFPESLWLERVDAGTLAGWVAISQGAISACGGTLYEFAALGLPFVGVIVADNQRAYGWEVARIWQVPVFESIAELRANLAAAVEQVTGRPRKPFDGIDLFGAARVADALENFTS